jgi:inner membrane protein
MDSLSQIVLGAAVGEAVLGRKIGNRAMVWGAVGGTIPDLDVLGSFFMSDLNNLMFHRGVTHSILFSVLGAIVFGWIVFKLYESPKHKWIAICSKVIAALVIIRVLKFISDVVSDGSTIFIIVASLAVVGFTARHIWRKYLRGAWEHPGVTIRDWQWLFFMAFSTHIVLDCFTLYGTQIFAPFSYTKISWGTISVADPIYTVPFLIFLLIAALFSKSSKTRRILNHTGIAISCLYLVVTIFNKNAIETHFENELKAQNIEATNFITSATIFNNVLWSCTAETDDYFYLGEYSFFDDFPVKFDKIEKNHHLLRNPESDYTMQSLSWFSDGYYCITESEEGLFFNDLRFGVYRNNQGEPAGYIFTFLLEDLGEEGYKMHKFNRSPREEEDINFFTNLFRRIGGSR